MRVSDALRAFLLSAALPALAAGTTQLIQSVPSETALAHPGLAFARDAWVEVIRGARTRLDFAEFYIAQVPGGALEPVLRELEAAGARGVKTRFILSSRMLDQDPASVERLKRVKGLELRIFDLKGVSGGILHAKYFLADGREAVLGSQNFDWRALEHIHELGLRSTEPALVDRLQEVFEADWAFALDKSLPKPKGRPGPAGDLELVASPPFLSPGTVRPALDALVELLDGARTSIQVQLLQYSPVSRKGIYWNAIDRALRAAAVRGVKVQLLISDWVYKSRGLAHLKSLAVLPNVEVRIASIPEASTGHIPYARTIHSKYLVVDGAVLWVGTSNWEEDYFEASRNVEAILRRPEAARLGGEIFTRVWTSPYAKPLNPVGTYTPRKVD
ncbi:phospholipase D-like domain-containing protein [Mesoterricola sediminis]|uniref:Phospholipase n=1 Tax=Mesoterricola sediminis TaxID=2927980 RepID=A0AA48GVG1_9BACT|nr:phospholipase D-like domain-containing protein [Mesoterricola sediminis]BDU78357.1 phospholipase [Mesoterricola sediminis]